MLGVGDTSVQVCDAMSTGAGRAAASARHTPAHGQQLVSPICGRHALLLVGAAKRPRGDAYSHRAGAMCPVPPPACLLLHTRRRRATRHTLPRLPQDAREAGAPGAVAGGAGLGQAQQPQQQFGPPSAATGNLECDFYIYLFKVRSRACGCAHGLPGAHCGSRRQRAARGGARVRAVWHEARRCRAAASSQRAAGVHQHTPPPVALARAHPQVQPCPKRGAHDWSSCPYAHPKEKARRRDPRIYSYASAPCPESLQGVNCGRGVDCPYAHSVCACARARAHVPVLVHAWRAHARV
jgi:hypothetical protein